jgi:hypothetical protein
MYRHSKEGSNVTVRALSLLFLSLFFAIAANAQVEVGDYIKMNLAGNLGFGYTGNFGNESVSSNHSSGFQTDATLSGYYFHPNFINFSVRPFFNRQQSNAESQLIGRATGIGTEAGFFGGSRFPGSVSFSQDFSSNSILSVAGVPSVVGDTSGHTFGVTWSAIVPNYPQLRLTYASGASSSTVSGLSGDSDSSTKSLSLESTYDLAGFNIQGNIHKYWNHYTTPGYLTPEPITSGGESTTYGIAAQHRIPLSGSFGVAANHSTFDGDDGTHWTANNYTANASVRPIRRFSFNQTLSYATNLSAYLIQSVNPAGTSQSLRNGTDTDSLYLSSIATVYLFKGLSANGYYNHRQQSLRDRDYSNSQYGGTLAYNYNSPMLGMFYFGFGVVDVANKFGNQGTSFVGNAGLNKKFGQWDTSADVNYQQNVQTLATTTATSSFNYGGSLRRRVNTDTYFSLSARASHTALVANDGDGSRAESFGGNFGWRRYAVGASYSQSSGTALLTSAGVLTSVPLGSLITDDIFYFDAKSYSFVFTVIPLPHLTVTGGYVNVFSSSRQRLTGVTNSGERYHTRFEYRLRKFSIIGGFTRNVQDISTVAGGARVVNSYYLTLSRWFNVF